MKSDPTLRRWYRIINRRFFDGACCNNTLVRWMNPDEEKEKKLEDKYFALAQECDDGYHKYEIMMSRSNNRKASQKLSTLAHEMIHIATDINDDHGPAFEKWRMHIAARGIFKKNALLKGGTTIW